MQHQSYFHKFWPDSLPAFTCPRRQVRCWTFLVFRTHALWNCFLSPIQDEITEVILMGGGTRIPKIQEILQKTIGRSVLLPSNKPPTVLKLSPAKVTTRWFKILPKMAFFTVALQHLTLMGGKKLTLLYWWFQNCRSKSGWKRQVGGRFLECIWKTKTHFVLTSMQLIDTDNTKFLVVP